MWWGFGAAAAGEYYAGYLIEKSLSIDNVFVWAVILGYFKVPNKYQFRVLFWGVFGALVLRAIFIFAGVALLDAFAWLLFVFGAFLLYTAWKLAQPDDHEVDPEQSLVLRAVRRVVPTTNELHGQKMFVRENGHLMATPLFAVLVLIEATDVVFAVDSVPAILAVSREPFLVLSSNAFAILGLRALYFAFAGMKDRFRYLDYGLAGDPGLRGDQDDHRGVVPHPHVGLAAGDRAAAVHLDLVVAAARARRGPGRRRRRARRGWWLGRRRTGG